MNKVLKELQWIALSFGITLIPILFLWIIYGSPIEINNHDTFFVIPLFDLFLAIFFILSIIINIVRIFKMKLSSIPFLITLSLQLVFAIGMIMLAINQ